MNIYSYVKSRLDIVDVIGKKANLKEDVDSSYWKGDCPFCKKEGQFTVAKKKGLFYCFGCHETGDIITFVAKYMSCGVSQLEAARFLADEYEIELPVEWKKLTSGALCKRLEFINSLKALNDPLLSGLFKKAIITQSGESGIVRIVWPDDKHSFFGDTLSETADLWMGLLKAVYSQDGKSICVVILLPSGMKKQNESRDEDKA